MSGLLDGPEFDEVKARLTDQMVEATHEVLAPFVGRLETVESVSISTHQYIGSLVAGISAVATMIIDAGICTQEELGELTDSIAKDLEEAATLAQMEQDLTGGSDGQP